MPTIEPIKDSDLPEVSKFLHENMNSSIPVDQWMEPFQHQWIADKPNNGFKLMEGEEVVGVFQVIYSERMHDGRMVRFGNLVNWYVLEPYRKGATSIGMLKTILGQEGIQFFANTPSPTVVRIYQRLKFEFPPLGKALIPALPWISSSVQVLSRSEDIEASLDAATLKIYRDHKVLPKIHHVVLKCGDEWCYFIYKKVALRNVLPCASLLHVSNPEFFRKHYMVLGSHLFLRRRAVLMSVDMRFLSSKPTLSLLWKRTQPTAFQKGPIDAKHINNLYSELMF